MNQPYVDDKLIHFGFSLGTGLTSYTVTESGVPVSGKWNNDQVGEFQDQLVYPREMHPGFNFSVGFITDLRLARCLNLRFIPELHFEERSITYKIESYPDQDPKTLPQVNILSIPIYFPILLKWSADRESNYRPYVVAGGGVSYDFGRKKENIVLQQPFDYFVQVGFGCDFYFRWFKLCPEIKYQLGFNNMITPLDKHPELPNKEADGFYTSSIDRLRSHMVSIVFNFE